MINKISISNEEIEEKVNQLIGQMTLAEKIGQLNQVHRMEMLEENDLRSGKIGSTLNASGAWTGLQSSQSARVERCNALQKIAVEESRLGIPLIIGRDVIHGYRTVFPIPLGQAATWNPEIVEEAARIAAFEATADGIKWTFAPMIDIARDARWGRIAEGFGEDPYLASTLTRAVVHGFQGNRIADHNRLVACAKHYVGYGAAEGGRDYDNAEISMRTLRDIYLPPYKAAVNAGVATIMAAFHDLNGIPLSANHELLTEILRKEWGFQGFVVSDWESIRELVLHGVVRNQTEAAWKALKAGVDMDMVSGTYLNYLVNCLDEGLVSMQDINQSVRRILRVKHIAGLFDEPYVNPDRATQILTPEYRQFARKIAAESIVLLKNQAEILPLGSRFRRILITGDLANAQEEFLGTWAPDGQVADVVSLPEAIRSGAPPQVELRFTALPDQALWWASRADVAVVFLGEHPYRSGENNNVSSLELPAGQGKFLEELADQGLPIILVILAGRPLAIPREARLAQAVLYAWHPGIEGGAAITDILFGSAVPLAKLPVTMPRATGQVPIYYNHKSSGRPSGTEFFPRRYIDIPQAPLFPFGYGLSYTQFEYTGLQISSKEMTQNNEISVNISNIGNFTGTEIAQFYLRDLVGSVTRPIKELKGFQRVTLQPGETQRITFNLSAEDLLFTGIDNQPTLEAGEYQVWVGPNSDSGLQDQFILRV